MQEGCLVKITDATNGRPSSRIASLLTRYRSFSSCQCGWFKHRFRIAARRGRRSCFSDVCRNAVPGERIASELGRGTLEQVYIKGEKGYVVLMSVGEEAVLTALAREQAKLGLIFLDMRRAAVDLAKLI